MANRKKEADKAIISDIPKHNILVDKGASVQNYINEKIKYSETEGGVTYSNEETHNIVKDFFKDKSLCERAEIVLTTFGRKFNTRSIYNSITELMEILPYASDNLNIMIIGDKGTGKTGMYQAPSNIPLVISEQPTNSDLRGNKVSKGTPFFDYPIMNIDEIGDFECREVISTIKSFEEKGSYLKYGTEEHKSKCSIVKCGNNSFKITNFQELTAKNILIGISPEWATEAYLSRQTALIYHSDILPLTKKSFVEPRTQGLNTDLFLKNLNFLKRLRPRNKYLYSRRNSCKKTLYYFKSCKELSKYSISRYYPTRLYFESTS